MTDVSLVTDRIWTGADLPSHLGESAVLKDLTEIQAIGITHVVDCRVEWSDDAVYTANAPDVSYLHHPQDDAGQLIPDEWFEEGTAWASSALADPDAQVLLHCHMGINRGPSLTYALLLSRGVGHLEALDLIRTARPVAAIAYAEQACDWWLRRAGASEPERDAALEDIASWREEHQLDVVRLIRTEHEAGR